MRRRFPAVVILAAFGLTILGTVGSVHAVSGSLSNDLSTLTLLGVGLVLVGIAARSRRR